LSLPAATPPHLWAISGVGIINIMNELAASGHLQLSDKIMTPCFIGVLCFMFGWSCVSKYICIINQHDARFVFTLLTTTVPLHVLGPFSGVPRNFFQGGFTPGIFFGGSTNSVEGRGQRVRGSGGGVAP
jgi:hypothetical protein